MEIAIRNIGNSKGVVLPKPFWPRSGWTDRPQPPSKWKTAPSSCESLPSPYVLAGQRLLQPCPPKVGMRF